MLVVFFLCFCSFDCMAKVSAYFTGKCIAASEKAGAVLEG